MIEDPRAYPPEFDDDPVDDAEKWLKRNAWLDATPPEHAGPLIELVAAYHLLQRLVEYVDENI